MVRRVSAVPDGILKPKDDQNVSCLFSKRS